MGTALVMEHANALAQMIVSVCFSLAGTREIFSNRTRYL